MKSQRRGQTKTCRSVRVAEDVKEEKKENKDKIFSKLVSRKKKKDICETVLTAEVRTAMTQTSW
jgi:hypothetical protein